MQTYLIRTFGCQMNKHDSECVAGLLDEHGMHPVQRAQDADVLVFMTCCVRENADERLRGQVRALKNTKSKRPGQLIAVGGCIGQRDGQHLQSQIPHIDVVFGTHNTEHLPALLETAHRTHLPQVEVLDHADSFVSDSPIRRAHPWHAWMPITVGCDNHCSYCIVPHVRGRERSRPLEEVVDQVAAAKAEGVVEVTLLGQNVNSYGRDLYDEPRFSDVLRAVADAGVPRIRFATSHPKDLSRQTVDVMASTPSVMPYLHLPVQSGSDRVLAAMNRRYTHADYLRLVDRVRSSIPGIALSTDVIVGFPGETEEDFSATLDLVRAVGYEQAFTFIYSPREGTPAASMADQIPRHVAQERLDRLLDVVHASALRASRAYVGTIQRILVEGASKRDSRMLSGRTPTYRVVHARVPKGRDASQYAGRMIDVRITDAQTWFLSGELEGTRTEGL